MCGRVRPSNRLGDVRLVCAEGNVDHHSGPGWPSSRHFDELIIAIEVHEPRSNAVETHAGAGERRRSVADADAVVLDRDSQAVITLFGVHPDRSAGFARPDSMPHGVLDEWLKNQVRHVSTANSLVGVDRNSEPVLEACRLNRQILLDKAQLFVERDLSAPIRL